MAPTITPRARCATSISVRGGRRSASTPNGSSISARGIPDAISTTPSARPERVRSMTSHDSATMWNWSPISEMASLPHRSRKSRTRRACHMGSERAPAMALTRR